MAHFSHKNQSPFSGFRSKKIFCLKNLCAETVNQLPPKIKVKSTCSAEKKRVLFQFFSLSAVVQRFLYHHLLYYYSTENSRLAYSSLCSLNSISLLMGYTRARLSLRLLFHTQQQTITNFCYYRVYFCSSFNYGI